MSLVHWELFNLCSVFNPNHNSIHELPYQRELNGQKPNIAKLQEIVSKGMKIQKKNKQSNKKILFKDNVRKYQVHSKIQFMVKQFIKY